MATFVGDKVLHYRIISSPVKDDSGKVIATIEMVDDITARMTFELEFKKHVLEMEGIYKSNLERESKIVALEEEVKSLKKQLNDKC